MAALSLMILLLEAGQAPARDGHEVEPAADGRQRPGHGEGLVAFVRQNQKHAAISEGQREPAVLPDLRRSDGCLVKPEQWCQALVRQTARTAAGRLPGRK